MGRLFMRRTVYVVICLSFTGITVLYSRKEFRNNNINLLSSATPWTWVLPRGLDVNYTHPYRNLQKLDKLGEIQSQRLRHLSTSCGRQPKDSGWQFKVTKTITMTIPKYDINYCKVPKVGCTFIAQMFKILSDESASVSEVFYKSRRSVHDQIVMPNVTEDDEAFRSKPTVLMARNPYSRLYSAYVDKIYIPSGADEFVDLQTQLHPNDVCGFRPKFRDFLTYVINTVHEGKFLNKHWAPIHALCKPCSTNYIYLIKQETFSDDVKQLMDYLEVSSEFKNSIISAMTVEKEDISIPGIIHTTFNFSEDREIHYKCLNKIEVARLLWESFQIQGYIRADNPFPVNKILEYSPLSVETIADVIMMLINGNRLSDEESKYQRLFYLRKAYEDIPKEILIEIQNIYKGDFELFDYDINPPHYK